MLSRAEEVVNVDFEIDATAEGLVEIDLEDKGEIKGEGLAEDEGLTEFPRRRNNLNCARCMPRPLSMKDLCCPL